MKLTSLPLRQKYERDPKRHKTNGIEHICCSIDNNGDLYGQFEIQVGDQVLTFKFDWAECSAMIRDINWIRDQMLEMIDNNKGARFIWARRLDK